MCIRNTSTGYGSVAKFLHWTIALLVIVMLTVGFFLDDVPDDYKGLVYNIHKLTGLTILSLMILRLIWTLVNPKPVLPAGAAVWERWAEHLVHWGLYVAVIAMPVAGWVGSSAADKPPHLGEAKFLLPVTQTKALAESSFQVHEILAYIIIGLLCLHVGAALFHHFVRKDNVLKRMWIN